MLAIFFFSNFSVIAVLKVLPAEGHEKARLIYQVTPYNKTQTIDEFSIGQKVYFGKLRQLLYTECHYLIM
jgi:hypothetical protein